MTDGNINAFSADRQVRIAALEEACRAACRLCHAGNTPVKWGGWYHRGPGIGFAYCHANDIRRLIE